MLDLVVQEVMTHPPPWESNPSPVFEKAWHEVNVPLLRVAKPSSPLDAAMLETTRHPAPVLNPSPVLSVAVQLAMELLKSTEIRHRRCSGSHRW